jgi:cell division protein FtsW
MKDKKPFDFWLFMTVLIMLSLGLIMVFSASAPTAAASKEYNYDIYYIVKTQLMYAVIGIVVMLLAANYDYRKYGPKTVVALMGGSLLCLFLVLIPGIGREINGSWRWIYIGPLHFQPSEIAKLALILFLAYSLSKRKKGLDSFFNDFVPYLLLIGLTAALLMLETHLSATIIICGMSFIILFAAGARIRHFFIISVPLVAVFSAVIMFTDYMTTRINSFIDPWSDLQGDGWQTVQSLYAIGSGGIFGRGLGQSMEKFLYIPEPHNDYIFSILAEELGFIGVLAVLLLFLIFIWRGIKIAMNAPDVFGSLVATGITALIGVQSLFNVAVVSKVVPPTGVSLPFFSSGGSSLVLFLLEVGILLNISRYADYERI